MTEAEVIYYKFDENNPHYYRLNEIRKSVIEILHYIPRRLKDFTSHGSEHTKRTIKHLNTIIKVCDDAGLGITELEAYLLYASAWLHDIGCLTAGKEDHSLKSAEMIEELQGEYIEGIRDEIPFLKKIVTVHSKSQKIADVTEEAYLYSDKIRLRFIAALFRLADACDFDRRRAPKVVFKFIKSEFENEESKEIWKSHQYIDSVSFDGEEGEIVIGTQDEEKGDKVIKDFMKDLRSIEPILEEYGFPCINLRIVSQ